MGKRGAARILGGATPGPAAPLLRTSTSREGPADQSRAAVGGGVEGEVRAQLAPTAALGNAVGNGGIAARLGWRGNVGYRGAAAGDPELDGTLRGHLSDAKDALRLAVIELDGGGARDGASQAARRAGAVRDLLREAVVSLSRARLYRREIFSFDVAVVYAEEATLAGELRRLRGLLTSLYWRNLRYLQFDDVNESRRSASSQGGTLHDGRARRGDSGRERGRGRKRWDRSEATSGFESGTALTLRGGLVEQERAASASGSERSHLGSSLTAGALLPSPTEHDDVAVARFVEQIKAGRRRRIARWSTLTTVALVATAVAPAAITAWVLPVAAAAACVLHLWPRHGRREREQEPSVLGLNAASPAAGPALR